MTPVRWGFLGAGFIASRALAPAVHSVDAAELVGAAARDVDRAARLGPARAFADYRTVLDDPDVDVVYVALANDAHLPWVLAALEAGKHVLCEKPLGLTASEVEQMTSAAQRHSLLLVEAFWYRWHPRTRRAEALVRSGAIGDVTEVDAQFCFSGVDDDNYRLDPTRGGGARYDVGGYTVDAAVWAAGSPTVGPVRARARLGPTGVDLTTEAEFRSAGAQVKVRASIDDAPRQQLCVTGSLGRINFGSDAEADAFTSWLAPSGLLVDGPGSRVESFAPCDPYALMVEAVGRAVRGGDAFLVTPEESLAVAQILDVIAAAATLSGG